MTDERLDQILKQALAPEIDDSEIQIQRKVRNNKMKMKKIITSGLVACAALALAVTGGISGSSSMTERDETTRTNREQTVKSSNLFAITACAAELPEGVTSGDVIGLSRVEIGHGSSSYLDGRFTISGQNIEKIKVTTDKCELYTSLPIYRGNPDYENALNAEVNGQEEYYPVYEGEPEKGGHIAYYDHTKIVGQSYEGDYNNQMYFGMSVPEELWSTSDDPKEGYHETVDQVNGATLTIEVTFADGSAEVHHYRLNTGKIYVPADENGYLKWDNLTRFLTADENTGETPYTYGYLMEKID
ncbi:MAG: hypothetical protein IJ374_06800 [Lachnospiraceae bacterium]|nr:hypothetical protein [Lachnospiraceae bacterium]